MTGINSTAADRAANFRRVYRSRITRHDARASSQDRPSEIRVRSSDETYEWQNE
jgi:hypothetical protein